MRNFRINAMTVLLLGLNVAVVNATDGNILNITTTDPDNANKIIEATNVKGPGHTAIGQQNQIYSVPESEEMRRHYSEEKSKGSSSAIGNQNVVKGFDASAIGNKNDVYGSQSQSFGYGNKVYSNSSMAFGAGNMVGAQPEQGSDSNNKIPAKDIVTDKNTQSGVAFGINNTVLGDENLALGQYNHVNGANSMAVGSDAVSNGFAAIALGTASQAGPAKKEDNSKISSPIAIGYSAHATATETIAIGSEAKASADDAIAIGSSAISTGKKSLALSKDAYAKDDNSVALGAGTITHEATQENEATVNGITYSGFAGHDPLSVVSVGSEKSETYTVPDNINGLDRKITVTPHTRQIINVGAGKISATSTDAINGSQLYMIAEQVGKNKKLIDNISTLSSGAKLEAGDNIDVETNDDANQVKTYKVSTKKDIKANSYTINNSNIKIDQNGMNAGNKKVINVANGENDNDAVNVSQLNKVKSDMANNTKAINTLNKKVNDVDRKSRAGIAGVAAIASAPSARKDGRSMVSTGVAHHRGESAIAIKASRNSDNGHWSSNVNGATDTRGQWTVGAGVGYEW
ncbi:YadA-like family protein [Haemophilus haemolyticus]|uniref:YadA-like family protein n=1 Tax=Haemophilus haemolyticus TaxID=726 RepID=UPI000E0D776E|nr:YadA-like family protein [Haemophilus haemolyticus]